MKNKLIIIGTIIAIILVVIVIAILNYKPSTFTLESKEDGSIAINAENADENSGGATEITIQEGQKLEVKANLEEEASIKVKLMPSDTDNAEAVLDESFKQTEEREFEVPAGDYNISVTAEKGATGNMNINIK